MRRLHSDSWAAVTELPCGRDLPAGVHDFETVDVGDRIRTGTAVVSAERIDAFAALTGDRFEIHMDADAARARGFGDRVAHGLLVLSLVDGLKNLAPAQFDAVASLGWDWRFERPVLVGDSLRATITLVGKRRTTKGDRGILELDFAVENQRGETVQSGRNRLMVRL